MDRYNPFNAVAAFEKQIAEFTGAPRAVAVDTCTAALFLSFEFCRRENSAGFYATQVAIPRHTFVSVPMMAVHAGYGIRWTDEDWQESGGYRLSPLPVFDYALRLDKGMFSQEATLFAEAEAPVLMCLSFQYRKPLPIGRGGMILHNLGDRADNWFRRARFFGRHEVPAMEDPGPEFLGWHMYMEPERASKGLTHFMHYPDKGISRRIEYPDVSKYAVFRSFTREGSDE